jgi:hypothetical protein
VSDVRVPLAEAIQALRRELRQAIREGSAEDLRFGVGPVEIECDLVITREAAANGGVRFWLITAEGKGSHTSALTQRVRLTLMPEHVTGGEVKVTSLVEGHIG